MIQFDQMNGSEITVYGTAWCPASRRAQKSLERRGIPYRWIDIDQDSEGRAFVEQVNHGMRSVPTILFADGSILVEPSEAALAAKLGAGYTMVTKRQLGIALSLAALIVAVGVIAIDWVGAGEWSGFGPLQWLGLGAGVMLLIVGIALILRGNRPA